MSTVELQSVEIASPPAPPLAASRVLRIHHLWTLLFITILGGTLRFGFIDKPALWGDEAMTFSRICGSYQDLIDILQYNGFAPLHYEMYWWIANGMPTRFAIEKGPIAYPESDRDLFARVASRLRQRNLSPTSAPTTKNHLIPRSPLVGGGIPMSPRVMRFVPALAGTLMIPAMYFLARQIASKRIALLTALFTATSAYLLVYSRDAKMYMHFYLCCALSAGCFLWWLRTRTRIAWLSWVASSLAMCGLHAPGAILLGIELIIFLTFDRQWWLMGVLLLVSFLIAALISGQSTLMIPGFRLNHWKWIWYPSVFFTRMLVDSRWIFLALALVISLACYASQRRNRPAFGIYFLVGLGVILSGIGGYYGKFNQFKQRIDSGDWQVDSMLGWVEDYNRGRTGPDHVLYAATAFLYSWEWPASDPHPRTFGLGLAADNNKIDPRMLKTMRAFGETFAALLIAGMLPWRRWSAIRRGKFHADNPIPFGRRLFWILAWIVVPAYAFYCVSVPGFASPLDWINAAGSVLSAQKLWLPAMIGALVGSSFFVAGETWKARFARSGATIGAIALVLAICFGAYELMYDLNARAIAKGSEWHSLWMPRYIGFIWPAFAIAVCALLMRLPTRPLRFVAITFLVAANLFQFVNRVVASEPPTDQLAKDVFASQPRADGKQSDTRAFTAVTHSFGGAPGQGLMNSFAFRYYMTILSGQSVTPFEFRYRRNEFDRRFSYWTNISPSWITSQAMRSPELKHIIVWDRVDPKIADRNKDDSLKPLLIPNGWRRVSEQVYTSRDHWTWMHLYDVRRREYVRTGAPAPASTTPTTAPTISAVPSTTTAPTTQR